MTTKNKETFKAGLEAAGFDMPKELLKCLALIKDPIKKAKFWAEICKYDTPITPKVKAKESN